jgi:hypothetical protein
MEKTLIAIEDAFVDLWANVIASIPSIVAAIAVFVVGLIIASLAERLVRKLVEFLKVDALAERMKVHETLTKANINITFADVMGKIVKWFFIIVFLNAAVEVLGWTQINDFLNDVLRYIPNVLIAVIMLAIGLIVASFVETLVTAKLKLTHAPVKSPEALGAIAKWAVIVTTTIAAVTQLGVAVSVLNILFGGVVLALALAFGLGGRERAAKFLDRILG